MKANSASLCYTCVIAIQQLAGVNKVKEENRNGKIVEIGGRAGNVPDMLMASI